MMMMMLPRRRWWRGADRKLLILRVRRFQRVYAGCIAGDEEENTERERKEEGARRGLCWARMENARCVAILYSVGFARFIDAWRAGSGDNACG